MKSRKRVVLPSRPDATRKGITLRRDMFWMDGCLLKLLDIFVECIFVDTLVRSCFKKKR